MFLSQPRSPSGHLLSIVPFNPHRQVPQQRVDSNNPLPSSAIPFSVEAPAFIPTGPSSSNALEGWNSPGGGGGTYPELGGMGLGFGQSSKELFSLRDDKLITRFRFSLVSFFFFQVQVSKSSLLQLWGWDLPVLRDSSILATSSARTSIRRCRPTICSLTLGRSGGSLGERAELLTIVDSKWELTIVFFRFDSARVMRDDAGTSKGFGFVSFQTPQEGQSRFDAFFSRSY